MLPPSARAAVLARMQDLYRPALARFDLDPAALAREVADSNLALLRADLLWFMALDAEDPETRAVLSRLGQAYLGFGGDGALHPEVLHPNLVRVALLTAAGDAGEDFVAALVERLRGEEDPALREHLMRALAFQTDPATLRRVWALILDPAFPKRDASELLRRQSHRADNQAAIFDWIVAHYDELAERLPRSHRAWLPWRSSGFCSLADRDRVEAFYRPFAEGPDGNLRTLENVIEGIELCAAIADAQRADALATLMAE